VSLSLTLRARGRKVLGAPATLVSAEDPLVITLATMIAVQHPVALPEPPSIPANAPEHCPVWIVFICFMWILIWPLQGTESEEAGKADACNGCANQDVCASGVTTGPDPALPFIKARMAHIRRKVLILSGKGGVGKSTFTAQLGWALAADEHVQVCLLSPSAPSQSYRVLDGHHGR
jgi:hypothetical protein